MLSTASTTEAAFAGTFAPGGSQDLFDDVRLLGRPFSAGTGRDIPLETFRAYVSSPDIVSACRNFDGSFCAVVLRRRDRSLHLIGDPVATIPLLYAIRERPEGRCAFFASSWQELLSLLARHGFRPRLNPRALAKFMFSGYVWGDDTLLEGVYQVPPGSVVAITADGCTTRHYYTFRRKPARSAAPVSRIRHALERVLHTYRGSRLLVTLSGGWDSRALLALACRMGLSSEAVTLGYADDQQDDLGVAVELSRLAGVPHHRWQLKPEQFAENADWLIMSSGGMCDAVISYCDGLAGYTRVAQGFDVVLRGDECFGWGTTSLASRHAKKQLALYHLPPTGVAAPELQQLFADELRELGFDAPHKSPDDAKNEFYWRHRLPRYIMPVAHWQRLACPSAHIEHPYLSRGVLDAVAEAPGRWLNDKRCERQLLREVSPTLYGAQFPLKKCWYLSDLLRGYPTLRDYLCDHVTSPGILDDYIPLDSRRRLADAVGTERAEARLQHASRPPWRRRLVERLKTVPLAGTLLTNLYALKANALGTEGLSWLIRAMCVKVFMDQAQLPLTKVNDA